MACMNQELYYTFLLYPPEYSVFKKYQKLWLFSTDPFYVLGSIFYAYNQAN